MVQVRRAAGRVLIVTVDGGVSKVDAVRLQQELATTCLRLGERPIVIFDLRSSGHADVETSEVFRLVAEGVPRPIRVVLLPGLAGTIGAGLASAWEGDLLRRIARGPEELAAALRGAASPAELGRSLDVFPEREAA
jgi:hypothetical protein